MTAAPQTCKTRQTIKNVKQIISTGAYKAHENLSDPVGSSELAGFGFSYLISQKGDARSFLTNHGVYKAKILLNASNRTVRLTE